MQTCWSVYVQYVPCGPGHLHRRPMHVTFVDENLQTVFNTHIDTEEEVSMVQSHIQSMLTPRHILVGYDMVRNIYHLGLQQQLHFQYALDLRNLFAYWSPRHQNWNYYSFYRLCHCLLNLDITPEPDVIGNTLMQLFLKISCSPTDPGCVDYNKYLTWWSRLLHCLHTRQFRNEVRERNITVDSCSAAFSPRECTCNQHTLFVRHAYSCPPVWYPTHWHVQEFAKLHHV